MSEDKITLTLNAEEEKVEEVVVEEAKPEVTPVYVNDSTLTEEEKKQVEDFAKQIDLTQSNVILQYGAAAQKKISSFSESTLNNVRTKDLGEVGDMLGDLVVELKGFDAEPEEKGLAGLFKKGGNKVQSMKARFDKAELNVNKIASALESHQIQLMKDIAMLDEMYDKNLLNF